MYEYDVVIRNRIKCMSISWPKFFTEHWIYKYSSLYVCIGSTTNNRNKIIADIKIAIHLIADHLIANSTLIVFLRVFEGFEGYLSLGGWSPIVKMGVWREKAPAWRICNTINMIKWSAIKCFAIYVCDYFAMIIFRRSFVYYGLQNLNTKFVYKDIEIE